VAQLLLVELRTALTLAAATAAAAFGLQDFSTQLGQFGLWQGRRCLLERLHTKVVQSMPGMHSLMRGCLHMNRARCSCCCAGRIRGTRDMRKWQHQHCCMGSASQVACCWQPLLAHLEHAQVTHGGLVLLGPGHL
jgi:hypothetical protein